MAQAELLFCEGHIDLTSTTQGMALSVQTSTVAAHSVQIKQTMQVYHLQKLLNAMLQSLPDLPDRLRQTLDDRVWRQPCEYAYLADALAMQQAAQQLSIDQIGQMLWYLDQPYFTRWFKTTLSRRKAEAAQEVQRSLGRSPRSVGADSTQLYMGRQAVEHYLTASAHHIPLEPLAPKGNSSSLTTEAPQSIELIDPDYQLEFVSRTQGYLLIWQTPGLIIKLKRTQSELSALLKASLHVMAQFSPQLNSERSTLAYDTQRQLDHALGLGEQDFYHVMDKLAPRGLGLLLWFAPCARLRQRCQESFSATSLQPFERTLEQLSALWQPQQADLPLILLSKVEKELNSLRQALLQTKTP